MAALEQSCGPGLRRERPGDAPAVVALVDRAFGPGRYARAAERLREANAPLLGLSLVNAHGPEIVGSVRLWPIRIGARAAMLLGPFAVEAGWRNGGLGARLIEKAVAGADAAGRGPILLVGDEPYFGRFGFSAGGTRRIVMPGPVDPRRLLLRGLRGVDAGDLAGEARRASRADLERSWAPPYLFEA